MSYEYELFFEQIALKEYEKLDYTIKKQFKNKLAKVLNNPFIKGNKLHSFENCYKIKLKSSSYRLIYQINKDKLIVLVIAIGKKGKGSNDKKDVYKQINKRFNN